MVAVTRVVDFAWRRAPPPRTFSASSLWEPPAKKSKYLSRGISVVSLALHLLMIA